MTTAAPRASSLFYAIPVFGWIAKDIARDIDSALYAVVIALTGVILAVMTWGLPALVLCALMLVPLVFTLLIWTTLP